MYYRPSLIAIFCGDDLDSGLPSAQECATNSIRGGERSFKHGHLLQLSFLQKRESALGKQT